MRRNFDATLCSIQTGICRKACHRWCRGFGVRQFADIDTVANAKTKTTPEINKLPVSSDPEIRFEPDIEIGRISESGHRQCR
jgi:hypothetical protein